MTYEEVFAQTRAEVSRLKSELKALEKRRKQLTDPAEKEAAKAQAARLQADYAYAKLSLDVLKDEYRWRRCVDREFTAAEAGLD